MKMPFLREIVLTCFVAVGLTASVEADAVLYGDPNTGSQRLSIEGGAAFPTRINDFSTSEQMGPVGGIQYLYGLNHHWSTGVQADYFNFPSQDHVITSDYGGQFNSHSVDHVATVEIMARYAFLPEAKWVPYIHSGVGADYFHQSTQGTPVNGSSWVDTGTTESRSLQDVTTINFSYSAGVGIETFITQRMVLGLEATWHIFGVSQSVFGTQDINVPSVSLRLGWRFGEMEETQPQPTGTSDRPL